MYSSKWWIGTCSSPCTSLSPVTVCFHQRSIFTFHSSSTNTTQSLALQIDSFVQQKNSLLLQQLTAYVSSTCYIWFTSSAGLLTLKCVTHFTQISCRLGISRLVIGNRTEVLHVRKSAANILNKQLCTTEGGLSNLLGVRRCWKFSHFKRKKHSFFTGCCTPCSIKINWAKGF
jgi:hypothetical protein